MSVNGMSDFMATVKRAAARRSIHDSMLSEERALNLTQTRNQSPGAKDDACQRMKSANGFFFMEYVTSVGTFHPLAKRKCNTHGGNLLPEMRNSSVRHCEVRARFQ
jgi:hypothetical protein